MKRFTSYLSQYFAGVPDMLRQRKLLAWLVFLVITAVLVVGIGRLKTDMTVESWFQKDDPAFLAYDGYRAQFGSEDNLLIVYKAKDGNVFSAESLEAARRIREELFFHRSKLKDGDQSALNHIVRVNSLANVSVMRVEGDLLTSGPLVGEVVPNSPLALDKIRKTAEAQTDIPLKLFSKDLQYGAILVETDFGAVPCAYDEQAAGAANAGDKTVDDLTFDGSDTKERPCFKPTDLRDYEALNGAVKAVLYKPEFADHLDYYLVGNTAESEYIKLRQQEMGELYLAALSIMIVVIWFLFRSFAAVLWAVLIVVLTTVWTLGISGFLDLRINPLIIMTSFLLITVGMADAIHVMSGYLFFRREGCDHKLAMRSVFEKASVACLVTAVTNVVGMSSLAYSDIIPITHVGYMASIGVLVALVLTIYLLPMMLEVWAPVPKREESKREESLEESQNSKPGFFAAIVPNFRAALQRKLDLIVPAVEKRPIAYIIPFFVVLLIFVYGVFQVRVDSDMLSLYQANSKFPQSVKIVDDKMSGSSQMSIYMDFGANHAAEDPFVLKIIDDLQRQFETKYSKYVVTTSSLVDIVKDVYKKLNREDSSKYIIPADQSELSQTLYMFNNADPDRRKRVVDAVYRKANVAITLRNYGTYEYNDVFDSMQKDIYLALDKIKQKYPDAQVSITGNFVLKMKLEQLLIDTGLQSFSLSFVVVNVLFLVIFAGSVRAGVIAIIPNIIPSILVVGLMGLLHIPLDFFAIILAPIIIGISADDTIHFLLHYRMQYLVDRDIKAALRHTMKEAGQGIVFTTLVLGLGFGILALSSTPGVAKVGIFGSLAMFVGLLNDLLLLPALITLFKLRNEPIAQEMPTEEMPAGGLVNTLTVKEDHESL